MPTRSLEYIPAPAAGLEMRHKPPALKALTPLRFLAALYVILFHQESSLSLHGEPLLDRFLTNGYTGVTFFFILSGFILVYNYPQISDRSKFWIARFARIYPLYIFSIALGVAHIARHVRMSSLSDLFIPLTLCITLLQSWIPRWANAFNFPAWTLSVEAFFYLVFPFLLPGVRKHYRSLGVLLVLLYFATAAIPTIMAAAGSSKLATSLAASEEGPFPIFRLPAFLVGIVGGLLFLHRGANARKYERIAFWIGVLSAIALLLVSPNQIVRPLRTAALAVAFALLTFGLASSRSRILCHPLSQLAGEISFSMYLLQFPVSLCVIAALKKLHVAYGDIFPLTALIALIFISWLSYRFLEVPARLFVRQLLTHKPVPTRPR
jgi:peptidoglycan/LPS O-acetylase OafA/YrhL